MRIFKDLLGVIAWLLIVPIVGAFQMIKYLIKGKSIIGKLVMLLFIAGIVCSFIFKPIVFKILMMLMVIADLFFATSMVKSWNETSSKEAYEESNTSTQYERYTTIPFFDGMTVEEAKKEYRKLMKCYHPDNVGGSLEMTQRISEAYSKYCAVYGR